MNVCDALSLGERKYVVLEEVVTFINTGSNVQTWIVPNSENAKEAQQCPLYKRTQEKKKKGGTNEEQKEQRESMTYPSYSHHPENNMV